MKCPFHNEVWLFEDDLRILGYCIRCKKWYDIEDDGSDII